jgi:hypothetical protein
MISENIRSLFLRTACYTSLRNMFVWRNIVSHHGQRNQHESLINLKSTLAMILSADRCVLHMLGDGHYLWRHSMLERYESAVKHCTHNSPQGHNPLRYVLPYNSNQYRYASITATACAFWSNTNTSLGPIEGMLKPMFRAISHAL